MTFTEGLAIVGGLVIGFFVINAGMKNNAGNPKAPPGATPSTNDSPQASDPGKQDDRTA